MRVLLVTILMVFHEASSKVFERCELARELLNVHEAPRHQVATWVCIAQHESQYNTSAVGTTNGDNSKDHGLFQISDLFWCSPPGKGWACGVTCAELEDDNIEDDFVCAKRIYREHKKLSGDGFNAWVVYRLHCSGPSVQSYVDGCFEKGRAGPLPTTSTISSTTTSRPPSTQSRLISSLKPLTFNLFGNSLSTEAPKARFQWFPSLHWT